MASHIYISPAHETGRVPHGPAAAALLDATRTRVSFGAPQDVAADVRHKRALTARHRTRSQLTRSLTSLSRPRSRGTTRGAQTSFMGSVNSRDPVWFNPAAGAEDRGGAIPRARPPTQVDTTSSIVSSSSRLSPVLTRRMNAETKSQDAPLRQRKELLGRRQYGVLGYSKMLARPKPANAAPSKMMSSQVAARTRVLAHAATRRDRLRSLLTPTSNVSQHMYPAGPVAPATVNASLAQGMDGFDFDHMRLQALAGSDSNYLARPPWLGGIPTKRNAGAVLTYVDPRAKTKTSHRRTVAPACGPAPVYVPASGRCACPVCCVRTCCTVRA